MAVGLFWAETWKKTTSAEWGGAPVSGLLSIHLPHWHSPRAEWVTM